MWASAQNISGAGWSGMAEATSLDTMTQMNQAFRNIVNMLHGVPGFAINPFGLNVPLSGGTNAVTIPGFAINPFGLDVPLSGGTSPVTIPGFAINPFGDGWGGDLGEGEAGEVDGVDGQRWGGDGWGGDLGEGEAGEVDGVDGQRWGGDGWVAVGQSNYPIQHGRVIDRLSRRVAVGQSNYPIQHGRVIDRLSRRVAVGQSNYPIQHDPWFRD